MSDTDSDIIIRIEGRAGRITLNRPQALNALTYQMCLAIEKALDAWRDDGAVELVIIDAIGDKAFCAGGDIQEMYDTGTAGDYAYGQKFWADEYRLNAKIATYPKPYIALMQGFTMGGGVGVSCHGSHRIVGETSQIAMPECGIGLVPDVGGSWILAHAPGHIGTYLGLTAARMNAADAIYCGFADTYVPEGNWPELVLELVQTGDTGVIAKYRAAPGDSNLAAKFAEIEMYFAADDLAGIHQSLANVDSEFATKTLKILSRNAPLSMACTIEMLARLREGGDIADALDLEYRFTARSMQHGDFLEGIRAAIIDKDRQPQWQHAIDAVTQNDVAGMLAPLGDKALSLKDD